MSAFELDLLAARCPSAMSYVRTSLLRAIKNKVNGQVIIKTIEQSMSRDLPYFIETLENITLSNSDSAPLSLETKRKWLESGEVIDEELEGIDKTLIFTININ